MMNTNNAPEAVLITFVTLPDPALAVKVTEALINKSFAACVHALPAGVSTYRWQGQIENASEVTLIIKTSAARYAALEAELVRLHPAKVPEIIAVPVTHGLPAYLQWVARETSE